MPCYDGRCHVTKEEERLITLRKERDLATAVACALCHELNRRFPEHFNSLILGATKKGEVDVNKFVSEHITSDEIHLSEMLSKYSLDELGVIRMLINDSLQADEE